MEKFIELVRDMHDECYEFVLQKIISQKIPVAVLSVVDVKNSFETAKNFRQQLNLTHFITLSEENFSSDFEVVSVYDAINNHLRPEYIFALNLVDARFAAKNIPRVDLIKLDVEGAELDVLKGATVTISRFKPILLLSAYHKWDDFWTLMEFVKALNPEYEFAMRQFCASIEDEPFACNEKFFKQLTLLGLEPCYKNFYECVLLAR